MSDWPDIALRFADYLDLMVLFGVPVFAMYSLRADDAALRVRCAALGAAASFIAAALSLFGIVAMAREMSGAQEYSAVTAHVLEMVVTRTAAGLAWAARMIALAACLVAAFALRRRTGTRLVVLASGGAVALATLAWTGHGAMDEGTRGYVHLACDVMHLLAAGAWVGALVAFALVSMKSGQSAHRSVVNLERAASGFAGIGTLMVGTLVLTGAINYVLILGPTLGPLVRTPYGRLLGLKLLVFGVMLGLAAANRYALSPGLAVALRGDDPARAERLLRFSLRGEAALGLIVLALVAWLGTLAPDA